MKPCSLCEKENRECVMHEQSSSRCAECVRQRRTCDGLSDAWEKESLEWVTGTGSSSN
jgi:hypothetical protein